MKYLKKMNESWSEDYTYDFKDYGFEMEENGNVLTGNFKGKFLITDVNLWLRELTNRIDDEEVYKISKMKTYFNEVTGNANFEIEIRENLNDYVNIKVGKEYVKFYPGVVGYIDYDGEDEDINVNNIVGRNIIRYAFNLKGQLENGKGIGFLIMSHFEKRKKINKKEDYYAVDKVTSFALGNKGTGISIDKDNLVSLFDIIESNNIKLENRYEYMKNNESELKKKLIEIKNDLLNNL